MSCVGLYAKKNLINNTIDTYSNNKKNILYQFCHSKTIFSEFCIDDVSVLKNRIANRHSIDSNVIKLYPRNDLKLKYLVCIIG